MRFLILLVGLIFASPVYAQLTIPQSAAKPFFQALQQACTLFPLGRVPFRVNDQGNIVPPDTATAQNGLLALEKVGLVRLQPAGERNSFGMRPYDVIAAVNPGARFVRLEGGRMCVATLDYAVARLEFKKIEPVKGGATKWNGAIAYVTVRDRKFSDLELALRRAGRLGEYDLNPDSDPQYRLLFREHAFDGSWRYVGFDYFSPSEQRFLSNRVGSSLEQD